MQSCEAGGGNESVDVADEAERIEGKLFRSWVASDTMPRLPASDFSIATDNLLDILPKLPTKDANQHVQNLRKGNARRSQADQVRWQNYADLEDYLGVKEVNSAPPHSLKCPITPFTRRQVLTS